MVNVAFKIVMEFGAKIIEKTISVPVQTILHINTTFVKVLNIPTTSNK